MCKDTLISLAKLKVLKTSVLQKIPLTVLESTGGTWGKTKSDVVRMILYGPLDILFLINRFL